MAATAPRHEWRLFVPGGRYHEPCLWVWEDEHPKAFRLMDCYHRHAARDRNTASVRRVLRLEARAWVRADAMAPGDPAAVERMEREYHYFDPAYDNGYCPQFWRHIDRQRAVNARGCRAVVATPNATAA